VQYRPTASELLATIAVLLDDELLPALPPELQHKARVAGNLARILEREWQLGGSSQVRERERLAALLGHDRDLAALEAEMTARLRAGTDAAFEAAAWQVLVDVARHDLAIAKPGHDAWEGA
jgi:hypothetical protein